MVFKIDKGTPLPPKQGTLRTELSETLRKLKVGDSFIYSGVTNRANVYVAARRLGMKVATRENGDGLRVWRIK